MEINIERKNIEDMVKTISRISYKGVLHPALKLSRINIINNKFTISATNLSLAIIVSFNIENGLDKEYFVDTQTLERILSGMIDNDKVLFSFRDTYIELKTKKAKARIPYQNGEDVPTIPNIESGTNIEIPSNIFKKALTITLPAASTTDIKPELSSLYISFKDNTITAVSTDAFQLIEYTEEIFINKNFYFLLPAKETGDILKIIDNIDGALSVTYTDTLFSIKTKTITIITKLTQGVFPDYNTIIPKNSTGTVSFLRNDLDLALKFLMQLRSETNNICIDIKKDETILTTKNSNGGDSEYIISSSLVGEAFSGYVMATHLKTLASNIPSDSVNLSYFGAQSPFIAENSIGASFKYLMMPVIVN